MRPIWLADLKRANGDARHQVEGLFLRALLTLAATPDRELKYFHISSAWPLYPHDAWFAYEADDLEDRAVRFTPTPADHDRMLIALAWGHRLTRMQWRICGDVADGYTTRAIADRLRVPSTTVDKYYDEALDVVCRAALAG